MDYNTIEEIYIQSITPEMTMQAEPIESNSMLSENDVKWLKNRVVSMEDFVNIKKDK